MKLNQERLSSYIESLDMMIAAISGDIARQVKKDSLKESEAQIVEQMKEAIVELHHRRQEAHFVLYAIEQKRQSQSAGKQLRSQ